MADYYYDKKGYRRFSDSGTPIHRWVAEDKLSRPLRRGEVVHHMDRDKGNNDPDNLWVFRTKNSTIGRIKKTVGGSFPAPFIFRNSWAAGLGPKHW